MPVEVSVDRITKGLHDLDVCTLDIWNLEFFHGGPQTHLYALKQHVDSYNPLVPRMGCVRTPRDTESNPLTPKNESGMRKAQVHLFCSDAPCIRPPKSSTQVLWIWYPPHL